MYFLQKRVKGLLKRGNICHSTNTARSGREMCIFIVTNHVYLKRPIHTILVIIKLTKFAVPVRLCCGSGKLIFCHNFIMCLGVSPGSKLCATFFNIAKYFETVRCGCGAVAFSFSIYLKPVLY